MFWWLWVHYCKLHHKGEVRVSWLLPQIQVKTVLWGIGTAPREIPPYFVLRDANSTYQSQRQWAVFSSEYFKWYCRFRLGALVKRWYIQVLFQVMDQWAQISGWVNLSQKFPSANVKEQIQLLPGGSLQSQIIWINQKMEAMIWTSWGCWYRNLRLLGLTWVILVYQEGIPQMWRCSRSTCGWSHDRASSINEANLHSALDFGVKV